MAAVARAVAVDPASKAIYVGGSMRLPMEDIAKLYQEKYGREISGPEYPATLDHMIAGVAG